MHEAGVARESGPARPRLLLVEDDPTALMLLARALARHDYEVITAADVQSALTHSAQHALDAAIVDLRLGRESGLTLIPQLLQQQAGLRILVLTGYASIATAVQAIKLGATDYLAKPVAVTDILAALHGQSPGVTREQRTDVAPQRPSARRLQWEYIQQVLLEQQGNISATARALGMQRRTLQRRLAKRPTRS